MITNEVLASFMAFQENINNNTYPYLQLCSLLGNVTISHTDKVDCNSAS